MFTYKIDDLTFSGGQKIYIGDADVVILVGANNCGKSRTLTEIVTTVNGSDYPHVIVENINIKAHGTPNEIFRWLEQYYVSTESGELRAHAGRISKAYLQDLFNEDGTAKVSLKSELLSNIITAQLSASSRLDITKSQKGILLWKEPFAHEIHLLQRNQNLIKIVSSFTKSAFKIDIVPDMSHHGTISIRVGEEPERTVEQDRFSDSYQIQMAKLPTLEHEGDGIRSYVGCLLAIIPGHRKLILLDEPEVFLHPPQAKRLGRLIADSSKENGQQLIVATHSSEIIQGVLAGTAKVAIIRINREENTNNAFLLGSDDLKELWQKPLLRSSGAIQGLFHQGVVVCESDADERFYEGIMRRLDRQECFTNPADFYFVHGGGKGELATLAKSYRALHIPTAVIADFDVLQKKNELEKLYQALGGNFHEIEKLYIGVSSALADLGSSKSKGDVISEVRNFIEALEAKNQITGGDKEKISKLLDDAREWSEAKRYGKRKLKGGKRQECEALLSKLGQVGLFIVPSGELESWDDILPPNKNEWILAALEKLDADHTSFVEASDFITQIAVYLGLELN